MFRCFVSIWTALAAAATAAAAAAAACRGSSRWQQHDHNLQNAPREARTPDLEVNGLTL